MDFEKNSTSRKKLNFLMRGMALFILPVGAIFGGLPAWFFEGVLVIQWITGVVLLSWVFAVEDTVQLARFPSWLLTLTVLRLTMTLGLIQSYLMHGELSGLAFALGQLVVETEPFAGIVVFLLLLVVQFFVITKGSERVSEVAARFSLDALPGQQMSIDADLRAGLIDLSEASRRRENLLLESRLFGAMDGALKFVRGDVIATALVTVITLVSALGLRVLRDGYVFQDAWREALPSVLGLALSGILPSLLSGLAAGILVTRPRRNQTPVQVSETKSAEKNILPTLQFYFSPALASFIADDPQMQSWWQNVWPLTKKRLQSQYPFLHWQDEMGLVQKEESIIEVKIQGILIGFWSSSQSRKKEDALQNLWERFSSEILKCIQSHLYRFVRLQGLRDHLNQLEEMYPDLVREVVPKQISLSRLTDLTRHLIEEKIPLQDMTFLLEVLTRGRPDQRTIPELVNECRQALMDYLVQPLLDDCGEVAAVILDVSWENKLEKSLNKAGDILALPPEEARQLRQLFREHLALPGVRALLVPDELRRACFVLYPDAPVPFLGFSELSPAVGVHVLSVIPFQSKPKMTPTYIDSDVSFLTGKAGQLNLGSLLP